jgi:hypothetical protein
MSSVTSFFTARQHRHSVAHGATDSACADSDSSMQTGLAG